jgi:predicted TPR repeat methyltransferase
VGHDEAGNAIFYALRLGQLLQLVGSAVAPGSPPRLLDAGCGNGWFSRELSRCGFLVDGVDASETAVETARAAGGGPRYRVSTLDAYSPSYMYDVVASIDVLFHLTDDSDWEASVTNLSDCVGLGGALVISDDAQDEQRSSGTYIVLPARLGLPAAARTPRVHLQGLAALRLPAQPHRFSSLLANGLTCASSNSCSPCCRRPSG